MDSRAGAATEADAAGADLKSIPTCLHMRSHGPRSDTSATPISECAR
jgi:hypothetical protein